MRGFEPACQLVVAVVEGDTQTDQVTDTLGALGAERLDCLKLVEPGTGPQGVCDVFLNAVVVEDRRRYPTLRIKSVALGQLGFRHQRHDVRGTRGECGHETGDPAADDDHARHAQAAIVVFGLAASIRSRATRAGAAISAGTVI